MKQKIEILESLIQQRACIHYNNTSANVFLESIEKRGLNSYIIIGYKKEIAISSITKITDYNTQRILYPTQDS